jgi:redox-sensitive bicupin YhaK (pirin superfamily)
MIAVRRSEAIYTSGGQIENGSFFGRWHFSFGPYRDDSYSGFGCLRVFNDDTLSPGAVWPMHEHHEIEVVTYCAGGVFRHADQNGPGGLLEKGDVQHTTVGTGMLHSEINDSPEHSMRFIQMWFIPCQRALTPSVEQKKVSIADRTDRLYLLVSRAGAEESLQMASEASVYSCFLRRGSSVKFELRPRRGGYLYVLEGGPVALGNIELPPLAAAQITNENRLILTAGQDAELLYVDTLLNDHPNTGCRL